MTYTLRLLPLTGLIVALAFSITTAQNVGVDVATPLEKLEVAGAIKVGTDVNNVLTAPQGGSGTIRFRTGIFEGWDGTTWVSFGGGGSTAWSLTGNSGTTPGTNFLGTTDGQDFRIRTNNTERISVSSTGEVAIGSTSTIAKLSISQLPADGDGFLMVGPNGGNTRFGLRTNLGSGSFDNEWHLLAEQGGKFHIIDGRSFDISPTGSERLTIDGAGNVGIGTTTPTAKLELKDPSANAATQIEWENDARSWRMGVHGGLNDGLNIFDVNANLTRIFIDVNGNVGLGTTDPRRNLHISNGDASLITSNSTFGDALIITSIQPRIYFEDTNEPTGKRLMDMRYNGGRITIGTLTDNAGAYTHFGTLSVTNTDKVGVNTGSPDTTFHVVGPIKMEDGNQAIGYIPVSDANGLMTWTDPTTITTADDGDWLDNGTHIYSGNTGNVGIGTNTPDRKLHIQDGEIEISSASGAPAVYFQDDSDNSKMSINYQRSFDRLEIRDNSNNVQLMVRNTNGYVGIGNNLSPSERLHVGGSIIMDDGNQAAGYIPVSNGIGKMTWTDPATITTNGNTLDEAYDQDGPGAGRVIIADNGAVRINGDDGFIVTGTYGSGDLIEVSGAGTRMFFNPNKAAFRVGRIDGTQWDDANIGDRSIAIGYNTIASNVGSVAFGYRAESSGTTSVALGYQTKATNSSSVAIGQQNISSGFASTALGGYSSALADYSTTIGRGIKVSGNYSFGVALSDQGSTTVTDPNVMAIMGGNVGVATISPDAKLQVVGTSIVGADGQTVTGSNAAIGAGIGNTVSTNNSFAAGYQNTISGGNYAAAFGRDNTISAGDAAFIAGSDKGQVAGTRSAIIGGFRDTISAASSVIAGGNNNTISALQGFIGGGDGNTVSGNYSAAFGVANTVSNTRAFAINQSNTAAGNNSFAGGFQSYVNSNLGLAIGWADTTTAVSASAFGRGNNARSFAETVVGVFATDYTPANAGAFNANDRAFTVGNGTAANARSNALTVYKNGKVNINDAYDLPTADGTANYVMATNGAGVATWTNPSSLGTNQLRDADNDTKVQVEESNDEDKIRFDMAGTERFVMDGPHLYVKNSGSSVFIGDNAGLNDDLSNNSNTFIGNQAGMANTSGGTNVAVGSGALKANTTASFNTAIGWDAMAAGTTANNSTAVGHWSLHSNVDGSGNIALGSHTLSANVNGSSNTAVGISAGQSNTGSNNVFVGKEAGRTNTGSGNVFLGSEAGENETGSNKLYIDNSNTTTPLIYGDFNTNYVGIYGRLGIGTATPNQRLQISDGGINSSIGIGPSALGPIITYKAYQGGTKDLHFVFEDQGGTQTEVMTLIGNGNTGRLGLGTISPSSALHVVPTDASGPTATIESGSTQYPGAAVKITPSTHATSRRASVQLDDWHILQDHFGNGTKDFAIWQQSTGQQRFNMDVNGNIGIGDETPDTKLDVHGSIQMVDGFQQSGFIPVSDANGTMTWTNPATITTANDGDWTISGSNQYSAVSGNVGIGTTTPNYDLDIIRNEVNVNQRIYAQNADGIGHLLVGANGGGHINLLANSSSSDYLGVPSGLSGLVTDYSAMVFATGTGGTGTERMRITTSGDVGIKTTDPRSELHISDGSASLKVADDGGGYGASLLITDNNIPRIYFEDASETADDKLMGIDYENQVLSIASLTDNAFSWNKRYILTAHRDGNVGINEGNPQEKLHVAGNIRMVDGNQAAGRIPVSDGNGTMTWTNPSTITTANDGDWTISGNDEYSAVSGNVGIGTTTPDTKLQVVGSAIIGADGQTNTGSNALVVGNTNSNSGQNNLVVGNSHDVTATHALVAGNDHTVAGNYSVVLNNANSNTAAATTSITGGFQSHVSANLGLAIGWADTSSAVSASAFGYGNNARSFAETVVGMHATSYTPASTGSYNAADRMFTVGNGTSASARSNALTVYKSGVVNINDAYNMPTADGSANFVMKTDGSGNVTWANPNTLVNGDNLGNHTATQNIQLNSNWLSNDGGNEGLKIDNSGYVAIGQAPSSAVYLDITGTNGGTNSLQLRSGNTQNTTTSNQILFGYNGTEDYRHAIKTRHNNGGSSGNAIDFYTWKQGTDAAGTIGTQHVMTLSSVNTGSVGIGTSSPASKLEVESTLNGLAVITIDQQGTDQYTGTNIQRDGVEQWFVGMNNADDDFIIRGDASADHLTILNSNGNVGIGITTPSAELSVRGKVRGANDVNETEYTEIGHGGAHGYINTVGDGRLDFRHDGNTHMSVLDNGRVGIGETNPASELDVAGKTTTDQIQVGNNGSTISQMQVGTATIGANSGGGIKEVTINFPSSFGAAPKVICTVRTETGQTYTDIFSVTTKSIGTSSFRVNVRREDNNGGTWGQALLLDWMAIQ